MNASGLSILVVDDNPDCVRSANLLLRAYGHDVTVALNGRDALRLAAEVSPDVVLLDIGLPDLDGYEVAKGLKAACRGKPPFVIAVSGRNEDEGRSVDAGIDLYLIKPFSPAALCRTLNQLKATVAAPR